MRLINIKMVTARVLAIFLCTSGNASFSEPGPVEIASSRWGAYLMNNALTVRGSVGGVSSVIFLKVSTEGKAVVGADFVHINLKADCANKSVYLVSWKSVQRDGSEVSHGGPGTSVPEFADLRPMLKEILRNIC